MPIAALLVCLALQSTARYTAVEIPHLRDRETLGKVLLTASGVVAGYWYKHVPPGHGGAVISTPFVWEAGRLQALPLGGAQYGHALGGNDQMILGDLDSETGWVPARWTPDPKLGWRSPELKVLSRKDGAARCVAEDGTIWGDSPEGIWSWREGRTREFPVGRFQVVGVDDSGAVYLNKQEDAGFAGLTLDTAYRLVDGVLRPLGPSGSRTSSLTSVGPTGIAIGSVTAEASMGGIWRAGEFTRIPVQKGQTAFPYSVNVMGTVVGQLVREAEPPSTDRVGLAALWEGSRTVDLSAVVAGNVLTEGRAINDRGQLLAVTGHGLNPKLYLLTPLEPWAQR